MLVIMFPEGEWVEPGDEVVMFLKGELVEPGDEYILVMHDIIIILVSIL